MLTIGEICQKAHETASQKGFHDFDHPDYIMRERVSEMLLLVVSEITEAMEALRDMPVQAHISSVTTNKVIFRPSFAAIFKDGEKPEGFAIELADAVIRICDTAQTLGIDLESAIQVKMAYNLTRPNKHGRGF